MDELLKTKTPLLKYQLFLLQLDWNLFWPPQFLVYKDSVPQDGILWNVSFYKSSQDKLTEQILPFEHLGLAVEQQPLLTLQHEIVAVH